MQHPELIILLTIVAGISSFFFIIQFIYLLLDKDKKLTAIIFNYILVGGISCVVYGFTHNIFVDPLYFNSFLHLDFTAPRFQAFLLTWSWRAVFYFLLFSFWLRMILKRAKKWQKKTKIFQLLFIHAALISTAWITNFEVLPLCGGRFNLYEILRWFGGVIGCFMLILLEFIFMEKKIIAYLEITQVFQRIRNKLIFSFLGITFMIILSFFGIIIGNIGIDSPTILLIKLLIFSILFIIPLVLIIIKITHDFSSDLQKSVAFLKKAAENDFTGEINISSKNEFGELGLSLLHLKKNLKEALDKVQNLSKQVGESGFKISGFLNQMTGQLKNFFHSLSTKSKVSTASSISADLSVDEMVTKIESIFIYIKNQSALIIKNTESVDEINLAINQLTEKTRTASLVASDLFNKAESGKLMIEESLQSIKKIQDSSQKINDINVIINEITDKTKLLAINAGIEAAHSDQKGKGFAVIANEMKKMAENTANNATNINQLINNILIQILDTLQKVDLSRQNFLEIHAYGHDTQDIITEMSASMEQESLILKNILNSMNDLVTSTTEINRSSEVLQKLSLIIKETFHHLKEISKGEVDSLAENSRLIQQQVDEMQVLTQNNLEIVDKLNQVITSFQIT